MAERSRWLEALGQERRLAAHTLTAYERDTRQFLIFLTGHLGGPATIADIHALRPADFRAFLAARRKDGAGARSLGRNLAGLRSLLRYLEKKGLVPLHDADATAATAQATALKPLDPAGLK